MFSAAAEGVENSRAAYDRMRLNLMSEDAREALLKERRRAALRAVLVEDVRESLKAARRARFLAWWFMLSVFGGGDIIMLGERYFPDMRQTSLVLFLIAAPVIAYALAVKSVKRNPPKRIVEMQDRLGRL